MPNDSESPFQARVLRIRSRSVFFLHRSWPIESNFVYNVVKLHRGETRSSETIDNRCQATSKSSTSSVAVERLRRDEDDDDMLFNYTEN